MTAIKAADVDAFIARPDPARPVVLVFGPDAGLVSERVNALVKASVDDPNDPFSLVRLEGEELAANPGRLVEEAQTIPLFGGRRAAWVKAGSRNIAPAVEALLTLPTSECRVVIEAGDLRRNAWHDRAAHHKEQLQHTWAGTNDHHCLEADKDAIHPLGAGSLETMRCQFAFPSRLE